MSFLIGTDEAGYGPNLGPLTIAGTLWAVPDQVADLYGSLQPLIGQSGKAAIQIGLKVRLSVGRNHQEA